MQGKRGRAAALVAVLVAILLVTASYETFYRGFLDFHRSGTRRWELSQARELAFSAEGAARLALRGEEPVGAGGETCAVGEYRYEIARVGPGVYRASCRGRVPGGTSARVVLTVRRGGSGLETLERREE